MSSFINRAGKASFFFALLAALGAATAQAGFNGNGNTNIVNSAAITEEGVEAVADEVLVVFKDGAANEHIEDALNRIGGKIKATKDSPNKSANGFPDFHKVGTSVPVMQAVQALKNHPAVELAEPNFIYQRQIVKPNAVVNDFYYADGSDHATQFRLWGYEGDPANGFVTSITWPYNNVFGSQADEAWYLQQQGWTGTQSAVVGIIDEGVCFRHPDLINNAWFNPNETASTAVPGQDDDPRESTETDADYANHKADDVNGWDFFEDNNSVYDDTPGEPDGDQHGTHVAGTIGAEAGNGIGVAGIAGLPGTVKMISGKFLGPNGGDTADAIDAINYFIHLKHFHGVNINALNNSWGGGGYSSLLHAAIIDAANEGILFVAAAGNGNWRGIGQNNDTTPSYPSSYDTTQVVTINGVTHEAGYDSVIAVAAIDKNGAKASFSNYGAKSVDIAAPGVDILSTYPWAVDSPSSKPDPNAQTLMDDANAREWCYQPMSGTSMATPHVTGAAALYAFKYPGASAAAIKKALLDTAIPTTSMNGKCVSNGRLNLARIADSDALPEPATKPTAFKVAQTLTGGVVAKRTAQITWNDSSFETGYELQRSTSSTFSKSVTTININADQSSYTDPALTSGTMYYYRLRAITTVAKGNSVYTATVSFRAP